MGLHTQRGVASSRVLSGTVPFVPNTTQQFLLPTGSVIEEITLKLTGTLTLAGYANGGAPTKRINGIENLIRAVRFTGSAAAGGSQTVQFSNTDAVFLREKTAIAHGVWPDRVDVDTANGVYDFESTFTKFFRSIRTQLPTGNDITALDTRKMQNNFMLNIDWRDATAMVYGGNGGTAALSDVGIIVSLKERYVNGAQDFAPYIKETQRTIPLGPIGSGIDRVIQNIPRGNFLLRQYFRAIAGDTDYADPTDAIFSTDLKPEGPHVKTIITGQRGSVTRFDVSYAQQVSDNRHTFKLDEWPEGNVVLEYAPTGLPKDFADLRASIGIQDAVNNLDLSLVANETNTLIVVDEEFVPNN